MADDKYLRKLDEIKSEENAKEEAKRYKEDTEKKATLLKNSKEKYKQADKSHKEYLKEDILKAQYLLKLGEPLYEPPNPHNTIPKNEALVIANYLMSKKGSVAFLGAKLYEKLGKGNQASVKNRLLKRIEEDYALFPPSTIREIESFLKRNSDSKEKSGLVKTISSIFLLFSIFFVSPLFTGNTIGNLAKNNSIGIGVILFVLGLMGLFIPIKK